jgi:hypothetical protein
MSKADATGESLESILASIRRSLAEQSTDILDYEAPADPPPEMSPIDADDEDVPRLVGGAGLNGRRPDAAALEGPSGPIQEDPPPPPPSALASPQPAAPAPPEAATPPIEEPPPPAPASLAPVPAPAPAPAPKDPLWFLGRGDAAAKAGTAAPAPAAATPHAQSPVADTKPVRAEIVRGPLAPFFGSSAEAAKVEVIPVPGVPVAASVVPPPAHGAEGDPPFGAAKGGAGAAAAETASSLFASPAPRDAAANGKAAPLFGPPPAEGGPAAAGALPQVTHLHGLEAMVAELLRPMLRRWLDENMPRLVSAALKAEAELIAKRDPRKP